jgi:hypothetical protein
MIPRPRRGPPGPSQAPEGPADLLLACHERIRRFSAMARDLATWPGATPADVADAAARVARYFSQALPLHVEDEDRSVAPRLAAAGLDEALAVMGREHREAEALLAELAPLWDALAREPGRLADLGPATARGGAALVDHMARHLAAEEAVVLPAVRALDPAVQADVVRELRARRAT